MTVYDVENLNKKQWFTNVTLEEVELDPEETSCYIWTEDDESYEYDDTRVSIKDDADIVEVDETYVLLYGSGIVFI